MKTSSSPVVLLALLALSFGKLSAATTAQAKLNQIQADLDAAKAAADQTAAIDKLDADLAAAKTAGPLSAEAINAFQAKLDAAKEKAAAAADKQGTPPPSALNFFKTTGVNYSNRAAILTTDIIAATAHCFDKSPSDLLPHTIGILLTGSVPLNNPEAKDYLTAQLLQRNGAVGNFFFSFHIPPEEMIVLARNSKGEVTRSKAPSATYHKRRVDKSYFLAQESDELLLYMTNGWGGRMYRFNTGPGAPTNYYGVATGYLGFGLDGIAKDQLNGSDGSLDLEVYATANYTNAHTLNTLYGVTEARAFYSTANATLRLNVSDFTIALSYASSLGQPVRRFAKDLASVSVSYTGK